MMQQSVTPPTVVGKRANRTDVLIVGNGIAGVTTALEARRLSPTMSIVLATSQPYPTINTPALKQYTVGKLAPDQLLAYPPGTERANAIHVVHEAVEQIDCEQHVVRFPGDRWFGYGQLILATGSLPRDLPISLPGREMDGVMALHRLEDYRELRRRLPSVSRAVVIGGGVHAAETVMSLCTWGIQVTWLIRSEFMAHQLDHTSSEMLLSHIRRLGVQISIGTTVAGIVGRLGTVAGVLTENRTLIPCQLVVNCTGSYANTWLARQCAKELTIEDGVLVNDSFQTNVQDIYAVGDVAAVRNPQTERFERRAQWYAATLEAHRVATALTSHQAPPPFGTSWHATRIGTISLLMVGDPLAETKEMQTHVTMQAGYRRVAMQGDRLIGYLALGKKQPDSLALKRIIDEGIPIDDIRELLAVDFDARAYLLRRHSRKLLMVPSVAHEQLRGQPSSSLILASA